MIFGLETYDADDLRTRIAFAQLTCGNAILGEVGSIGCRAISFRIVAKISISTSVHFSISPLWVTYLRRPSSNDE